MGSVKAWKAGESGAPKYPAEYEIVRRAVLQVTDLKSNHNKYYALELHEAKGPKGALYRVFTHYGRTDDLERNPDAGQKECRYFEQPHYATAEYEAIYREKTSPRKGYREVALASSKIGSQKARGASSGQIDDATLARLNERVKSTEPANDNARRVAANDDALRPQLEPGLARLVRYLYAEATHALTTTVQATITANGIETPLGVLTLGQIELGEQILAELYAHVQSGKARRTTLETLSGRFYTAIPHRIGRTREAIAAAVIESMSDFEQKQETLQLMKDMLRVNGEKGAVLFRDDLTAKYEALRCDVRALERTSDEYASVASHVVKSRLRGAVPVVKNVFAVQRAGERERYDGSVGNEQALFHGSRVKNWVGILSRGLVLPKIAVSMGVSRTDAGWLGNGIYFGDAICTAMQYAAPGRERTRFVSVARVALGRPREFTKITYGLTAPPQGFDSCHGVRSKTGTSSQFADDEWVIYDEKRQQLEYLVELGA